MRLPTASLLLVLLALATPAGATTFVRVADGILADQAALIAEVRVLEADPMPDAGRPVTDYLVEVERVVKGFYGGSRLTVRLPGGLLPDGGGLHVYGAPRFDAGERALLFLKPRPDGTYAVLHLMQGAFHLAELEGPRVIAFRDFSHTLELEPAELRARHPEAPRDLESFRRWLEDRLAGETRAQDYFVEPAEIEIPGPPAAAADKFVLLRANNGDPLRFREFDSGGSVTWRAHRDGQPGLDNTNGEVRRALNAWTDDPGSTVRYPWGGTTAASAGFTRFDGVNAFLFNDPNDEFDTGYNCASGGTVAMGGPWFDVGRHDHNGMTFRTSVGGDVVTNRGISCAMRGPNFGAEVFAHELGHTLGLGHTSVPGALMQPSLGRPPYQGPVLRADDRQGIAFLYGASAAPPEAPNNLAAAALGPGRVELTWRDRSAGETGFQIERRLDGEGTAFERIATAGVDATRYGDAAVSSGLTYTYRVRAVNGAGASGYSNPASATTSGELAPTDLAAAALSPGSIRLTWRDNALTEGGYAIEGALGEASGAGDGFTLFATVAPDSEEAVVSGLDSGTIYRFRVRAVSGLGESSYSGEAIATSACLAGADALCLNGGRFQVKVDWRDFTGNTGVARVVPFGADDSGLLWFFAEDNWEMLVKVLDGCGFNDRFWVFAAATTDVEYTLTVTDTLGNTTSSYGNALGNPSAAITDTGAFDTCGALAGAAGAPAATLRSAADFFARAARPSPPPAAAAKAGECTASDIELCLNRGRFRVEVDWRDFAGNAGSATVVPFASDDSGLFWFFAADNWEMLVKVLDGCGSNGRYWVFSAATTNVGYTLRVTDTTNGRVQWYQNPLGTAAPATTDTTAFDSCP